jgi:hypothetical protein
MPAPEAGGSPQANETRATEEIRGAGKGEPTRAPPIPPTRPLVSEEPRLSAAEAAEVISSYSSRRHLTVLSADSMMGRDTERSEIWMAARYIAQEFGAMGLEPVDEDGDFIVEYTITVPEMRNDNALVIVEGRDEDTELRWGRDFAISPTLTKPKAELLVLAPMVETRLLRENPEVIPEGSLVLAPFPLAPMESIADNLRLSSWMLNAREAGAAIVGLVLPAIFPADVIRTLAEELKEQPVLGDTPILMLSADALNRILEVAGLPETDIHTVPTIQEIPVSISVELPITTRTFSAPNVVARLPGRNEAELKDVVLTAHFDHEPPGLPNEEGDSIYNGADDNASGTVGLLEIARAFSTLAQRPARSVVFAAVSGEEMGLLGSDALAETGPGAAASTVANLNMDMLSRNDPDSLYVFAQTYSSLGQVLQSELAKHPELGLRVRPGIQTPGLDLIRFSDQASYLERGVPVLFFHSGLHPEVHTPDDEFSLTDTGKLARAARLVFFTALAVANDPTEPVWTAEGRARAEGMGKRFNR